MRTALDADAILDETERLLAVPSVVGYERPLLDHVTALLRADGVEVRRTLNLTVATRGNRAAPTLSAHVDRHGLVCTGPGTFSYAAHALKDMRGLGTVPTHNFASTVCNRFADEQVRAYDPATGAIVAEGVVEHAAVCNIEHFDVTVPVRGLDAVKLAMPVAFSARCRRDGDRFAGQLDNALSAATLIEAFRAGFTGAGYFTAGEEIGVSWQYLLADLRIVGGAPGGLLVLDTSPYPDHAAVDAGVVVLRGRDSNGVFDEALVGRLCTACDTLGAPYEMKDEVIAADNNARTTRGEPPRSLGSTELGRLVHATAGAVNGATLQLPTSGYHTNSETTSRHAVANFAAVLSTLLGG